MKNNIALLICSFLLLFQCGFEKENNKTPLYFNLSQKNGKQLILTIENGSEKAKKNVEIKIDSQVVFAGKLRNRSMKDMQYVYAKIDAGIHHIYATFDKKRASCQLNISADTIWCLIGIVSQDTILIKSQNKRFYYD